MFDGYRYFENEYCQTATYENATTISDAVEKCSNDPDCAAVEDRWGSGRPPIGLCKKFKGKRSGAGSFLVKKGNEI